KLDLHAAVFAVTIGVRRIVSDDVVAANVFLSLANPQGQVIRVEKRFAAGVGGKRRERLLRIVKACPAAVLTGAGEDSRAARGSHAGIASGSLRDQTARVHR